MTITIEGEVYDESGQYLSGRASVLAHPASVYVGLRTDRYFGREKTPLNIDLIAVTPDSAPVAGQKIALEAVEVRWERIPVEGEFGRYYWQQSEIAVETAEVVTGMTARGAGSRHRRQHLPRARHHPRRARARQQQRAALLGTDRRRSGGAAEQHYRPDPTKTATKSGDTAALVLILFTGVSYG
jgi:hypothetical protein